jgi:hypothetical protein
MSKVSEDNLDSIIGKTLCCVCLHMYPDKDILEDDNGKPICVKCDKGEKQTRNVMRGYR